MYSFPLLEASSPKSMGWQGHIPSKGPRRDLFLASSSFCWLRGFLGLWLHRSNLCLCLHMPFSPLCVSPPWVSCLRTPVIGFGAHLDNAGWSHLEILNYICKDAFSKWGHVHQFWGLVDYWEVAIQPSNFLFMVEHILLPFYPNIHDP